MEIEKKEPPPQIHYGPADMAISYKEPARKGPYLTMGIKAKLNKNNEEEDDGSKKRPWRPATVEAEGTRNKSNYRETKQKYRKMRLFENTGLDEITLKEITDREIHRLTEQLDPVA